MRHLLQETVTEHIVTYSDNHMRDFIDVYLKEMKQQNPQKPPFFFGECR
jgi:hypothetical protein